MSYEPLRHVDAGQISGRLNEVAEAAVDVVAPSTAIKHEARGGELTLSEPMVAHDGLYDVLPVTFTRTALRQQAERFDVPLKYVDVLDAQQPELLAHNFNERSAYLNQATLYRMLRDGDVWRIRATLSNGYQAIDNLDVLAAVVRGAQRSGIDIGDCHVEGDWTDDRFRLRIAVPQISIHAPDLLRDYRSPFDPSRNRGSGYDHISQSEVGDYRVGDAIWAGLEVSNSETGGGAASIAPRIMVLACRNGMVRKVDAVRSIHLGGKLEVGPVQWSAETRRKAVELVEAKMADAVNRFCSTDYLDTAADDMRTAKGLDVENPVKAIEVAQQRLGFTDGEVESALAMFVRSGDTSVLGLGQAFTAAAQTLDDGDRQSEIEQAFWSIVAEPRIYAEAK